MPKSKGYFQYSNSRITKCGVCRGVFNSVKLLELHKKVVHNDKIQCVKKGACAACGFTTKNLGALREHQRKCGLCVNH